MRGVFNIFSLAVASSPMDTIIGALTDVFNLVGTVFTEVIGNPVLLFFLAASLIPIGIGIFRQLRHSVQ